jgi:hypothetical protein
MHTSATTLRNEFHNLRINEQSRIFDETLEAFLYQQA